MSYLNKLLLFLGFLITLPAFGKSMAGPTTNASAGPAGITSSSASGTPVVYLDSGTGISSGLTTTYPSQIVIAAQQALVGQGFTVTVDGVLTPQTQNALRQFQASHGLGQSGVLDDQTLNALNVTTQAPNQ